MKRSSVTRIVSAATQTRNTRNAETQTDETDFCLMYQDEHGVWHEEVDDDDDMHNVHFDDAEMHPDLSMSADFLPNDNGTGGNLVYDNPEYIQMTSTDANQTKSSSESTTFMAMSPQKNVELRQAGRRKLEPVRSSMPVVDSKKKSKPASARTSSSSVVDPIIKGEINWSVSQLRTLFNQGQMSPTDNSTSSSSHSSSTNSSSFHNNARFTNGEYIESSKSNKASRQMLRDAGGNGGGRRHLARADELSPRTKSSNYAPDNSGIDDDSDQESYV